jgi:hypothetical protein
VYRRSFIKLLGQGIVASCGFMTIPSLGWSKDAFDYALEGQDLIQKKHFSKAIDVLKNKDTHGVKPAGILFVPTRQEYYSTLKKAFALELHTGH